MGMARMGPRAGYHVQDCGTHQPPLGAPMDQDVLRRQLAELLDGVGAHMPFDEAVADFPDDALNQRPPNVDYTPWHLLEHLRLTQADILDYVTNEAYVEPSWPVDYWPSPDALATRAMFDRRSVTLVPTCSP